ncbi:Calx-beta domain-containing protein [Brevundimonas sp. Root1423]|uniref:Calx-beta domain-containing protein n=1 Tax=Brevundimonas sp. Root1423 TaxID=1736462 RepID=UPI0006F32292|nr:Calx-beta domain-containing protein [Brevundimonas sp. Root1423]KQY89763.1 hypothetical protein ASD25_04300 [Brevundimonas sp. Root1423]
MPTTLAAGDIAIIGVNADDPDSFAFVVLTEISAGTQITFTDNGWTGTGFRTGEGVYTYTFATAVPAGTVINVGATGMSFSGSGDSIIAYQGTAGNPTFLYAVDFADGNGVFAATASNSNTSAMPSTLEPGRTAIALPQDNVAYNGPTSGSRADILAAIANPANWVGDEAARQTPPSGPFSIGDGSLIDISDASVMEGDAGARVLTFTVTRSDGSGAASVDFATGGGTATAGSDYAAAAGTVTFAAGETTKTVTITVNGDYEIENDETVVVTLSNARGGTIGDGSGVGAIRNDDAPPAPPPPFINEFHYDNVGEDAGEFIELAGVAGSSLEGYKLVLYNGANGRPYAEIALSGRFPDQQNGMGTISIPRSGLQNGEPDGFALVGPDGKVVEFLSYEGAMTATEGPAAGMTSTDVGVFEDGDVGGTSIGRTGTGGVAENFTWKLLSDDTPGGANTGQTFTPTVSVSDAAVVEGQDGAAVLRFTVTRTNGSGPASVRYATADGPANGTGANSADYLGQAGVVNFVDGQMTQVIEIVVTGDQRAELDETLTLNLSDPSDGLSLADEQGVGTIINDDGMPPVVRIGDAVLSEGDNGETVMTFTVTREGGDGAFTIDYATADGTATAGSDYEAAAGTLSFAAGETSKTISVVVKGDVSPEGSETLTVKLSNPTGDAAVADGEARGRIVNDDMIAIYDLQGAGHVSAFAGEAVLTQGVVTAIDSDGYYIQDATGDGDIRTSDAIFVYTGTVAPTGISVGDVVRVRGTVNEFKAAANQLSSTQLVAGEEGLSWEVIGTGTVQAVAIGTGAGERAIPTSVVDDDNMTSYDVETDAIDFYESLEGMVVTMKDVRIVTDSDEGGAYGVASNGDGATGLNDYGGMTLTEGDFNPEALLIYDDSTLSGDYQSNHSTGDRLGDVTGVMKYHSGEYELVVTRPVTVVEDVDAPEGEKTDLVQGDTEETGTADQLTVATYNLLNLNPTAPNIDALAEDIVDSLGTPDVISVVEMQDSNDGTLSGAKSAQVLIDAIYALSGVRYVYVEIAPTEPNSTGGAANSNLRNGFLYNPERTSLVAGSVELIDGPAFEGSRRPLSAQFAFNGEAVTVVSVHSSSRIGSDTLYGPNQPPVNAAEAARIAQSTAIKAYVDALLADDADASVMVLGDFNAFYFEEALTMFETGENALQNLYELLAEDDRYTYTFGQNRQAIDNIMISRALQDAARFDAVHLNTLLAKADQGSDHDALVTQLFIVGAGDNKVVGTSQADVLRGLAGNDTYIINHTGDRIVEAFNEGVDTAISTISYRLSDNVENLTLTGQAVRGDGNALDNILIGNGQENSLYGYDGDDVLDGGAGWDTMNGGSGNDIYYVDAEFDAVIEAKNGGVDEIRTTHGVQVLGVHVENLTGLSDSGQVLIGNAVNNVIKGAAGDDHIDGMSGNDILFGNAGMDFLLGSAGDDFLFGGGDDDRLEGGSGNDRLDGGAGVDLMRGESGNDILAGADGDDLMDGAAGADVLIGGAGNDFLSGGAGNDVFVFGPGSGDDIVTDYRKGDILDWSAMTEAGITATQTRQGNDVLISFSDGSSILLQNANPRDIVSADAFQWNAGQPDKYAEMDWIYA